MLLRSVPLAWFCLFSYLLVQTRGAFSASCVNPCFKVALLSPASVKIDRLNFFSTLAGAFGGAIAFGVGKLNQVNGLEGWRYLFLIEGAPSCAVAVLVFFFFPDWPETAYWLSESERELAVSRLKGVASYGYVVS